MRLIEKEAKKAFYEFLSFKKSNTEVRVFRDIGGVRISELYLYNNIIARNRDGVISVSNGGWFTNTTKSRLVNVVGANVVQKDFHLYLNVKEWDGSWTVI